MAKQTDDRKTQELPGIPQPKRRGRPPVGDRALTKAEKQRAYRQRMSLSVSIDAKTPLSLTVSTESVMLLDELAARLGCSRSAAFERLTVLLSVNSLVAL